MKVRAFKLGWKPQEFRHSLGSRALGFRVSGTVRVQVPK